MIELFLSLPASQRVLALILAVEVLIVVFATSFLALMRQRNVRREPRMLKVRTELGAWFANALLEPPSPGPTTIDTLLKSLPEKETRILLVELGEQVGAEDRRVVAARFNALGLGEMAKLNLERNPKERLFLVREARALGDPAELLPRLLRDPRTSVRIAAFEALCDLDRAKEAMVEMKKIAQDGPSARARLVDALATARTHPVEELVAQIEAGGSEATQVALDALGYAQDLNTRPVMIKCLADGNVEIRMRALRALRALGDPQAVEAARGLLVDDAWQVRSEAVRTCAVLGGENASAWIAPLLDDSAEWVRHHAAHSLLTCKVTGAMALESAANAGNRAAQSALAQGRLMEMNV